MENSQENMIESLSQIYERLQRPRVRRDNISNAESFCLSLKLMDAIYSTFVLSDIRLAPTRLRRLYFPTNDNKIKEHMKEFSCVYKRYSQLEKFATLIVKLDGFDKFVDIANSPHRMLIPQLNIDYKSNFEINPNDSQKYARVKFENGYHLGGKLILPLADRRMIDLNVDKMYDQLTYHLTELFKYYLSSNKIEIRPINRQEDSKQEFV